MLQKALMILKTWNKVADEISFNNKHGAQEKKITFIVHLQWWAPANIMQKNDLSCIAKQNISLWGSSASTSITLGVILDTMSPGKIKPGKWVTAETTLAMGWPLNRGRAMQSCSCWKGEEGEWRQGWSEIPPEQLRGEELNPCSLLEAAEVPKMETKNLPQRKQQEAIIPLCAISGAVLSYNGSSAAGDVV